MSTDIKPGQVWAADSGTKVKAGDTVKIAVKFENPEFRDFTLTGEVYNAMEGGGLYVGGWPLLGHTQVTLLTHTPAPEPESEWLFEFKGEGGPEGNEHWARRFPSRADALRSMTESASLDELNDFEGPVSFSVYTEETGPAESPLVVIDPAAVDWRGLQSEMSVLVVGAEPFKRAGDILAVVRRELGIEAP